MKTTIIGGSGFIGHRLCEACLRRGDEVTSLLKEPEAADQLIGSGVRVITADLSDEDSLRRACAGADRVFNCAGALGRWNTSDRELEFVNATAPGIILRCAAEADARRVIHVSTAGVSGPLPDGIHADEDYPGKAITAYQRTKLAGEQAALEQHTSTGMPLTIVRPTFVYGPGDMHKLPLFRSVACNRFLYVDQGESKLHPIYIADLVDGLVLASTHSRGDGDLYILGGPTPITIRRMAQIMAGSIGVSAPNLSLPRSLLYLTATAAETIGRIVGKEPPITRSKVDLMSTNYVYLTHKAQEHLGFRPIVSPECGLKLAVDWYRGKGLLQA